MLIILDSNAKTGKENHTAQIAAKYITYNETSVYGNLLSQMDQTHHENLLLPQDHQSDKPHPHVL
jgi:hypothetical protein